MSQTPFMNPHGARHNRLQERIAAQRAAFEQWIIEHRESDPDFVARLQSLLLFADGLRNHEIAAATGLTQNAVRRVRKRFELWGTNCIKDPSPLNSSRSISPH